MASKISKSGIREMKEKETTVLHHYPPTRTAITKSQMIQNAIKDVGQE